MDYTYYIFAFFVFLLICGAIGFYGRVIGRKKKDKNDSYEKEQRLFKLYQNIEDMLNGFEEYVEEVQYSIDGRIKKMEELTEETKNFAKSDSEKSGEEQEEYEPEPVEKKKTGSVKKQASKTTNRTKKDRTGLIEQYCNEGISKDDIAKKLGISLREVNLIMEIKKIRSSNGKT